MENPKNFAGTPGIITRIRERRMYLKVWCHVFDAKDAFPEIIMAELVTPDLKKLHRFCACTCPSNSPPIIIKAIKTNVPHVRWWDCLGWSHEDRVSPESLEQSVGVLTASDFHPVCD